jgi:hypothetical protein
MTHRTLWMYASNRWLILILNISRRRISVLRDVCEESTFCCVSASARATASILLSALTLFLYSPRGPRAHIYPFVQ